MDHGKNEKRPLLIPPSSSDNEKPLNGHDDHEKPFRYNSFSNPTAVSSESELDNPNTAKETPVAINTSKQTPVAINNKDTLVGNSYVKSTTKSEPEIKVYKRRWYILTMYTLFSTVQTAVWTTWGPISSSSERVFGWNDSTIAWLNNWGPVAFMVAGILFPWLLQVRGLRAAILGSAVMMSLGCTMRVISSEPSTSSVLIHLGQLVNGCAAPMAMGAMPHLSATWFPVHERVTATAIAASIGYFGTAVSFALGPALVSDQDPFQTHNNTNRSGGLSTMSPVIDSNTTNAILDKERNEIMNYMYYSCGVAWFITIIIFAYFPDKPDLPPCASAVVQRDKFWSGALSLRKKKHFLLIAFIYGISIGVLNVWATVLNINLAQLGIGQSEAGWIGFYGVIGCCFMSLVVGRFADYFGRMMKSLIFALYAIGTAMFVVNALMFFNAIPYSPALLYVCVIGGMSMVSGAIPLHFELACELAFPTSEGTANGLMTYINNVCGLVFLALFSVPNIGESWMNWMLVGSLACCLPLICIVKAKMRRLDLDEYKEPIEHEEGPY